MNYAISKLKQFEGKYKNLWGGVNLKDINPYDFEELTAAFFSVYFNTTVSTTRKSQDHGIDAYVRQNRQYTIIFQIKKYKKTNKVGEPVVRDLFGAMNSYALEQQGKIPKGIIVTTGDYSPSAIAWAQGKNIILINGERLVKLFHQKGFNNFYLDFFETTRQVYEKAQQIKATAAAKEQAIREKKQREMQQYTEIKEKIKIREKVEADTKVKVDEQYAEQIRKAALRQYEKEKRLELINKEIIHRETQQKILEAEKRLEDLKQVEKLKIQKVLEEEKKQAVEQQILDEKRKKREQDKLISKEKKKLRQQAKLVKEKEFEERYGCTYSQLTAVNILKVFGWMLLALIPICMSGKNLKYEYLVSIYINLALLIHILWKYIKFKKGNNIFENSNGIIVCVKGILGFIVWVICSTGGWQYSLLFLLLLFVNYFVLHQVFKSKLDSSKNNEE